MIPSHSGSEKMVQEWGFRSGRNPGPNSHWRNAVGRCYSSAMASNGQKILESSVGILIEMFPLTGQGFII